MMETVEGTSDQAQPNKAKKVNPPNPGEHLKRIKATEKRVRICEAGVTDMKEDLKDAKASLVIAQQKLRQEIKEDTSLLFGG